MARFSKDYTRQAKYGLVLSIASALGVAAMLLLLGRNFTASDVAITYGNKSYGLAVYFAGMVTLVCAVAGFWLGMGSWGEQRNERQRCSSIAFFVGAITVCLAIIMLAFFQFRSQLVG